MRYITTAERIGIERGIEKGVEKEKFEIVKRLLTEGVELTFIARITGLSLKQIKALQLSQKQDQ